MCGLICAQDEGVDRMICCVARGQVDEEDGAQTQRAPQLSHDGCARGFMIESSRRPSPSHVKLCLVAIFHLS